MTKATSTETTTLPPEIKAKWLAALRGGEIQQGRGRLLDHDGRMCCLGVLEHVCGTSRETILDQSGCLALGKPLGSISDFELRGLGLTVRSRLAAMNDGDTMRNMPPLSFAEIADWIEANL